MRKIDELVKTNFTIKRRFRNKHTKIDIIDCQPHLYLHDNLIAKRNDKDELLINHCGWETVTTRARLNSLPGVNIRILKGNFILNEKGPMEEGWINIDKL
jgi:hypothetical protein